MSGRWLHLLEYLSGYYFRGQLSHTHVSHIMPSFISIILWSGSVLGVIIYFARGGSIHVVSILRIYLYFSFQCFDTVGCLTGRSSGLIKNFHQWPQKVCLWATFTWPGLTWSVLCITRPVKLKPEVVMIAVVFQHTDLWVGYVCGK